MAYETVYLNDQRCIVWDGVGALPTDEHIVVGTPAIGPGLDKYEYSAAGWIQTASGGSSNVKPDQSAPDYDSVPILQTDYQLSAAAGGTGGAAGDYLSHVNYFISVATGNKITITDGGGDTVFDTTSTQAAGWYHQEVKVYSKTGGFLVTTQGNSAPVCVGDFT